MTELRVQNFGRKTWRADVDIPRLEYNIKMDLNENEMRFRKLGTTDINTIIEATKASICNMWTERLKLNSEGALTNINQKRRWC